MIFVFFLFFVVVGSVNVDVIVFVECFLIVGEIVVGGCFVCDFGGKGVNQVVVVVKFGVCVWMVGVVGDDVDGVWIRLEMEKVGVDMMDFCIVDVVMGMVLIVVDVIVENQIVVCQGVNDYVCFDGVDFGDDDVVFLQLEIVLFVVEEVVVMVMGFIVVNVVFVWWLFEKLFWWVDLFIVNEMECDFLFEFVDVWMVVVIYGVVGVVLFCCGEEIVCVDGVFVEVVNIVGVGDVFCVVFVFVFCVGYFLFDVFVVVCVVGFVVVLYVFFQLLFEYLSWYLFEG